MAQTCQPLAQSPPNSDSFAASSVKVVRLWIKRCGKMLNLLYADLLVLGDEAGWYDDVFPIDRGYLLRACPDLSYVKRLTSGQVLCRLIDSGWNASAF